MTGGYFCDSFQLHGRHDWRWQESTDDHDIWECLDCGCVQRDEIKPKVST